MIKEKETDALNRRILSFQKNEITEHLIYKSLASHVSDIHNKEIILKISDEELNHYKTWSEYTGKDVKPDMLMFWFYFLILRIFGITFGIKLMEKGEWRARRNYLGIVELLPAAGNIIEDEENHEKELINMIDEERLKYVGSMVLGLNDALVELTGTLAGLSFALQNTKLVAVTGLITGVAASLSMATSEYLSEKSEGSIKDPIRASLYTGSAYVVTVVFLIVPYLVFDNFLTALLLTLSNAVIIILLFTFYISVAKDYNFKRRFFEMVTISLGVTGVSFLFGLLIRFSFGIEI